MKKIIILLFLSLASFNLQAQTFIQAYQNRANQVSQTNITTYLQEFGSMGIKKTGTAQNIAAFNWLKDKYMAMGYATSQIQEDPFIFGSDKNSKNLIITKIGTVHPNIYVIICGHFDTIVGPGVNDNGSGTSIILEAARILKDVPTEYSIKFIHFSGEEQGLYGSNHYANNVVFQNGNRVMDIKLVFNLDQIGGKLGNLNDKIKCESDQSGMSGNNVASLAITQQLATCTTLYSPLQPVMSNAYSSDYMPFEENGEIITGFYENTPSNTEHTVNDTFDNVDPIYVFNAGKAAVGALQHFAVASTTLLNVNEVQTKLPLESASIFPNPAKDMLNINIPDVEFKNLKFELTDLSGRVLLQRNNELKINVLGLPNGTYLGFITINNEKIIRKILIER